MRPTITRLTAIVALLLVTAPLAVNAQPQPGTVRRIGVLMYQSRTDEFVPLFAAFRQGLREAGYVEGQNIAIEWQDARGSHARLPALSAELVRLKVEAIFAVGPQALREAKNTTGALPIVAIDLESDPVEGGYVASLGRGRLVRSKDERTLRRGSCGRWCRSQWTPAVDSRGRGGSREVGQRRLSLLLQADQVIQ